MKICLRFLLTPVLLALASFAHAGLSEIKADFPGQTGDLAASTVVAVGAASNGSYMLCFTVAGLQQYTFPSLDWTDENGNARSYRPDNTVGPYYGAEGCTAIRAEAGTNITAQTSGTTANYSLYVFGFGFWPGQPQKQGGLAEYTIASGGQQLIPAGGYLLTVTGTDSCAGSFSESGSTVFPSSALPVNLPLPFHTGAGYLAFAAGGGCAAGDELIAVKFGTPATGSGPLTDYEYNLLDWTNATYPNWKTVFTAGASAVETLVAWNIAEQPNAGTVEEAFNVTGYSGPVDPCPTEYLADTAGDPASCVTSAVVAASTALQIRTTNQTGTEWGASPTYSAEMDVIQF